MLKKSLLAAAVAACQQQPLAAVAEYLQCANHGLAIKKWQGSARPIQLVPARAQIAALSQRPRVDILPAQQIAQHADGASSSARIALAVRSMSSARRS